VAKAREPRRLAPGEWLNVMYFVCGLTIMVWALMAAPNLHVSAWWGLLIALAELPLTWRLFVSRRPIFGRKPPEVPGGRV